MPRKSAALIGPGTGPAVRLAGETARIQVRGIGPEEHVKIVQDISDSEDIVHLLTADGIYDLLCCAYARVTYEGKNKRFIACVLIGG